MYAAAYRRRRPDVAAAAERQWRQANPGTLAAKRARYAERYPEKVKSASADRQERRRARLAAVRAEPLRREEVFERDGWVCRLCLTSIDRLLRWPHPGSVSLDHVIPLVAGGEHSMGNSQTSHLRCNQLKGAN